MIINIKMIRKSTDPDKTLCTPSRDAINPNIARNPLTMSTIQFQNVNLFCFIVPPALFLYKKSATSDDLATIHIPFEIRPTTGILMTDLSSCSRVLCHALAGLGRCINVLVYFLLTFYYFQVRKATTRGFRSVR